MASVLLNLKRFIYVFLIAIPCLAICCLNCASYSSGNCIQCDTGYYLYNNFICVVECPTGYTAISGACSLTSSLVLIDVDFTQYLNWGLSTVGTLVTSNGDTLGSSFGANPVPTQYQGYYFFTTSYMKGTSYWVPSPDLTISMWAFSTSDGDIINIEYDPDYYPTVRLNVENSAAWLTATVFDQSTGMPYLSARDIPYTNNLWQLLTFTTSQISSFQATYQIKIDGSIQLYTFSDREIKYDVPHYLILGSSFLPTFEAFIYQIRVYNGIDSTVLGYVSPPPCLSFEYSTDGINCASCDNSCNTFPWCRSSSSCSPCYNSNCAYCTSFSASECYCSIGGVYPYCCQASCTTCDSSSFWVCLTCNGGYYNMNGICLGYCASGSCTSLTTAALIDVVFDTFLGSYSGFVTGANANTYYPFNSPDSDDPIPIYNRGLYFTSAMSLNNPSMLLAYTFTIGVWALPTSGNIVTKGSGLVIGSDGSSTIQIFDQVGTATSYTTSSTTISEWSFITVTVEFITDTTSITTYINNVQTFYSTYLDQIFTDTSPSTITIGSAYTGFVYGFKLWNSAVYSFSTETNDQICGTGSGLTCLLTCSYDEYYTTSCQACLNTCTAGCVRITSCDVCNSDTCLVCTSFGDTCTSCMDSITPVDGLCCHKGCASCSSYWTCTTCSSGYNNLAGICVGYCPSGSCTSLTTAALIDVVFDTFLGSYSGFVTGANANTYNPFNTPDSDDPIPIYNRGLYFTPAMSLNNPGMLLAYTFTIGVWALPTSGDIFTKGSGLVLGDSSFTIQMAYGSGVTWTSTYSHPTISVWSFITYTVEFITDATIIATHINNVQTCYLTYPSMIFTDTSPSTITIGSAYTGFVYGFKLWNSAVYSFSTEFNDQVCGTGSELTCLLSCGYEEYYTTSCQSCLITCTSGCVRSTSCDVCYSDVCLACTSYVDTCTSCAGSTSLVNGICCQTGCSSCTNFWQCNSCSLGYYSIAGICLGYCASGSCTSLTAAALIDVVFDTFLGTYSGFVTGANPMTYHPFTNPDSDDPLPISNRGLYFTPATSLNNPSILLAYTFTIGVWALPTSGSIFTKGSEITLGSDGTFTVQLLSDTDVFSSYLSSSTAITGWSFLTITVEFLTDTTSITATIGNAQYFYSTYTNEIFIDASQSTLVIGNAYTGFVYGFKFWNSAVTSFSYEVSDEVCGVGNGFACLSTCAYLEYYDSVCMPCEASCVYGCIRGDSCDVCTSGVCLICSSFTSVCASCPIPNTLPAGMCFVCYNGCLLCSDITYDSCESCLEGYYLWENSVCLNQCPTGYAVQDNSCVLEPSLVLSITLDQLILGSADGITYGSNATNIYPDFDANDPWPAAGRGYYFQPGTYLTSTVIIAPVFTVNIWVNILQDGLLLSKLNVLSLIAYSPSILQLFLIDGSIYTISFQVPDSVWCFLTISVDSLLCKIYLNTSQILSSFLPSLFTDPSSVAISISDSIHPFEGYVYSLEVYNQADVFGTYFNSTCPLDSFCLSVCNITEDPSNACSPCPISCSHGCNKGTCNLCNDHTCHHCNLYETCISCQNNSSFQNHKCTCNNGHFWNSTGQYCQACEQYCTLCSETECLACADLYHLESGHCIACPDMCLACSDSCTKCIPNASFNGGVCYCNLNFYGNDCASVNLTVTASVTEGNLILVFSDQLSMDLNAEDITVRIAGEFTLWSVQKIEEIEYKVVLAPDGEYPESNATLQFVNEIISIYNAELLNTTIMFTLSESTGYQSYKRLNQFYSAYSKTCTYTMYILVAVGTLFSNPVVLWSFVNTIQLLCFIPLANVNLTTEIQGILAGLRSYNIFPNIFEWFYFGGSPLENIRAVKLGFSTNSIILNTGKETTAFIAFMLQYLIFYLMSLRQFPVKFVDSHVRKGLLEYKYGFFLRYSIQYYSEFCISVLLGLTYATLSSTDGLINFLLALALFVQFI